MQINGVLALFVATSFVMSPVVRASSKDERASTTATRRPALSANMKKPRVNLSELKNQAFAGNPQAQFALAKMYEEGSGGLPKSLAYALSWYEEAARNGLTVAARKIASLSQTTDKE